MIKHTRNNQGGFAIVVSVLLVGILLSIVFTLSAIFIPKTRVASESKNSVPAAYAAESGLEWCLYEIRVTPVPSPSMSNESKFTVSDCATSPVKATGTYKGVVRAFEVTF